ncbi:MAG: hypothetical protein OEV46_07205 [Betaproteobacteria bacterium]|nr:hypothetical protein [Betaproteobacteria bacterium]
MSGRLAGRTALITAAGQGMGRAVVLACRRATPATARRRRWP